MTCKPNAATLAVLLALAGCGGNDKDKDKDTPAAQGPRYQATIQRTAYGIPHIAAADEAGLGFGVGYAYAEDNFCLLAGEIATVAGERSRYFGADGVTSTNEDEAINNLESDFFFRQLNSDDIVLKAWQAQPPEVQALMRGYAAGVNRYVADKGIGALPAECRNGAWVRTVTTLDIIRLTRRIALSAMGWVGEIAGAPAPGTATPAAARSARALRSPRRTASNGIAVGAEASADGGGLLLGQPHLAWGAALRFYQMHLTIPGKMDVMGASLPGLPIVGIGFTRDFAWTHTTDTSAHFTVYELALDPRDPLRYIVDGESRPLTGRAVAVQVKNADGTVTTRTRTMYSTEYGPLVHLGDALPWTATTAYALRDANGDNHRVVAQWYEMNKARSLADVKAANLRVAGNPWNYTIAADRAGNTLLMNVSPIANVPDDALAGCLLPQHAYLTAGGIHVLDGRRKACDWRDEPGAAQAGIVPASRLPVLERRDFVQNANDSAWLSNPAAPLTGFPALVSRDSVAQGARTKLALTELEKRLRQGKLRAEDLRDMALNDKVHLAPRLLPDLLAWCGTAATAAREVAAGCAGLAAWDGTAGLDTGVGLPYFDALVKRVLPDEFAWAVPFDAADPLHTPRGLLYGEPTVAAALAETLTERVQVFEAAGIAAGSRLRDFQVSRRGGPAIPVHGGFGELGIFNAIDVEEEPRDGRFEVKGGTTYVQVVGFDGGGPRAQALLAYSQSADPASPHHADQTRRLMNREWIALPFTAAEIAADPALRKQVIVEK